MKKTILLLLTSLLLNAENLTNSLGMEFVKIPAGSFMMGRDAAFEDGSDRELPLHKKHVGAFAMQTTEVTQTQWVRVMGSNPSKFKGRNNPVEIVNYYDIQKFIKKLNKLEGTSAYRLPTEAEWEYVARAGSNSTYVCGDDKGCIGAYAWYHGNSGERTHPVAQKRANRWGVYDISGNVWEWTSSCYTENYNRGCYEGGKYKVLRGGGWYDSASGIRLANRYNCSPEIRGDNLGFRLARTLP